MKQYYAYVRVSTTKQGEKGASLNAQRTAIEHYARQHDLSIAIWFEEQETAAKRGRTQFTQMLAGLIKGKAHGVLIHKIDRSARNLRDWSDLGELIDRGIEVHFVHESLDLTSRGGRLSADIQAVVASDFIRNLRQEIRKGINGRLKEGLYPWPAPHGYKNAGGGNPKVIDPALGPLVKRAFELYATGRYNLEMIAAELDHLGFRIGTGRAPTVNTVSKMLNNPFYMGLIYVRTTKETFPGVHKALIKPSLFEQVQDILHGRTKNQGLKHAHLYRKAVNCAACGRVIIGELQKGHVYYRCQAKSCKGTCVREEVLDMGVEKALAQLRVPEEDVTDFAADLEDFLGSEVEVRKQEVETREMRLANIDARLARVTDAYIDHLIEKSAYESRNVVLLLERAKLREEMKDIAAGRDGMSVKLKTALELMKSLQNKENMAEPAEKLDLLKTASSNLLLREKTLVPTWIFPGDVLAEHGNSNDGAPYRGTHRTLCKHGTLLIRHRKKSLFCKIARALEKEKAAKEALSAQAGLSPPSALARYVQRYVGGRKRIDRDYPELL